MNSLLCNNWLLNLCCVMQSTGDSLLVHPVTRSEATDVKVYFPGDDTLWYEVQNYQIYKGPGYHTVPVTINKVTL